ncbi:MULTISPECIES: HAD-IC family P-type ATPase [Vreelandella]|uniref:HAD-IC family P-type ATPase n=2 Tax=Vreelandella TaxID=3137766 RepID=A0A7C9K3I4_9GAMM|nr:MULTISPECIES: HAD-IC family P-type ATPase [Halomonas]NDL69462.1 HAD-IC family P-type ATPase [Halomonas alkaliphila]NYS43829.1 HAD-IC family P-type ATPase [Halomonas zhaodongensis]
METPQSPAKSSRDWHSASADKALEWQSSSADGLSSDEAQTRLHHYGPNRLQQAQGRPWYRRLLDQLNNILILILLVAAVASFLLGHAIDAAAIVGVVAVIALIGFIQEGKAEQALDSIRNMLSPQANVLRDGKRTTIPADELVPGDVVLVESGDRVPADVRLIEARRFRTEEAALTGESVPVEKHIDPVAVDSDLADRTSMAFASTIVVQGNARGLVVETGRFTEIGKISELLRGVEKIKTPLLQQLDRAGRVLAIFILGAAAITALLGTLIHDQPAADMFMAAVGLAVAAIPEGLPAIVTIGLALGVQNMARRNAIIRRLPAVETLGSISTIFSDKTGTLTRNEMTAQAIWLGDDQFQIDGIGFEPKGHFYRVQPNGEKETAQVDLADSPALSDFLRAGILCNDTELHQESGHFQIYGDPTEGALVVAGEKAGLATSDVRRQFSRLDAIPFESDYKYMATLHSVDGSQRVIVKGAPDRLIEMCDSVATTDGTIEIDQTEWENRIHELSSRGLRVLAIADKPAEAIDGLDHHHVETGLRLLGIIGLLDPPREEAIEAVKLCQQAGIRPVMITGDHASTALAIAKQLGFSQTEKALTGREIEAMSDQALEEIILEVDVFARASPEHKLRLVKAMQAKGGVCSMTGDGVNDGPALKRADVGVAMGVQGTEAAKDASEMVLADDNFATIVRAIEEGRKVYDNIRKTITFILPTNGAQGLAIMLAVLAGSVLPVTPLQALWVNMVVAITLGLALAFETGEKDLMARQPRDPKAPLLDLFLLWRVVFVSVLLLIGVFGMFSWILSQGGSEALARAGAVNMLVTGSAAYLINSRFLINSTLSFAGIFGSRPVWIAIMMVMLLQMAFTYLPFMQLIFGSEGLSLEHWLAIVMGSLVIYLLIEAEKMVWRLLKSKQA